MSLQRLVLTFKPEGIEVRTLYRTNDGPAPNTKARQREVQDLTRAGLEQALEALECAECVGKSGFSTREDILSITSPPTVISETQVKEKR